MPPGLTTKKINTNMKRNARTFSRMNEEHSKDQEYQLQMHMHVRRFFHGIQGHSVSDVHLYRLQIHNNNK